MCRTGEQPGYTIAEATQLARSSLPGHRASACQLLRAVLLAAQTSAASHVGLVRKPQCLAVASAADWEPVQRPPAAQRACACGCPIFQRPC